MSKVLNIYIQIWTAMFILPAYAMVIQVTPLGFVIGSGLAYITLLCCKDIEQ